MVLWFKYTLGSVSLKNSKILKSKRIRKRALVFFTNQFNLTISRIMVRQIKGIEESTLEVDFSVPFTRNCYVIYLLK